ncbi:MAG TPA: calmodulin [Gammaproteobacteria bacterium]
MCTIKTLVGAPLAAALIGACSPPAVAPFSELDRDGDGRISQQEATQDVVLAGMFADFDMDENGELTPFEYLQAANRR